MTTLEEARDKINGIDREMARLFEERMAAVEDVISYKIAHNMQVLDSGREQAVIERNSALIQNPAYKESYVRFITGLMAISRAYQNTLASRDVIGFQGIEGAFAHIALMHLFPGQPCRAYATWGEVFDAVEKGELAAGVIPLENSQTGEVGEVLDLLRSHNCYIRAVYDLPVEQNLLALPGAKLEDIREVYSHPQAIAQSADFLERQGLSAIPYANTALAARFVAEGNDPTRAAIASRETADIYGLQVLAPDIHTDRGNTTRFIVIGRELREDGNRFSLLFTIGHAPGQLARVVQIISGLGFNLESIKSRPLKFVPWQYYFYVEVVGRLGDTLSQRLLEELREICMEVKVLGSYGKEEDA